MTSKRIQVGAAILIGVVILALVAVALLFVFDNGADEQDRAGEVPAGVTATEEDPEDGAEGESTRDVEKEVTLIGIVPSPRIVRLDGPGEAETLTVRGYYSDGSKRDLNEFVKNAISYESSDPSVAQVDERGEITGVKLGGADIVVRYRDLTSTAPVLVWGPMAAVPPVDPERLLEVEDGGPAIVLNRVTVELEPGHDADDAGALAAEIGGQVVFEYRTFPGYLLEFDGRTQQDLENTIAILRDDERVGVAYADMLIPRSQGEENGEGAIETVLLETRGIRGYRFTGMYEAWKTMNGVELLSPVVIAVIDDRFLVPPTGDDGVDEVLDREFDYRRLDVRDAVDLAGRDVPWRNTNEADGDAHGVAVTGVIVARNNDLGDDTVPEESFSGVVTSVSDLAYHVVFYQAAGGVGGFLGVPSLFGAMNFAAVSAALEEITRYQGQIDVVNMSFGGGCLVGTLCHLVAGYDERWAELMAAAPDVTFVIAAGNDERDAGGVVPASFSSRLPNVITVGGTIVDVGEEGSGVGVEGRVVHLKNPESNYGAVISLGTSYSVWSVVLSEDAMYGAEHGTSLSAPLVTGTVALLKALDPSLTPDEIKGILVSTGHQVPVCNTGFPPCPLAERDEWAVLDAGEAVGSVLWPSVDAEIDLEEFDLGDMATGDSIELSIPVLNTGSKDWTFYLQGETSISPTGRKYILEPVNHAVAPGESVPFTLRLEGDGDSGQVEPGRWVVRLKLYRNPELTSSPDARSFQFHVLAPAESAGEEAPEPQEAETSEPQAVQSPLAREAKPTERPVEPTEPQPPEQDVEPDETAERQPNSRGREKR